MRRLFAVSAMLVAASLSACSTTPTATSTTPAGSGTPAGSSTPATASVTPEVAGSTSPATAQDSSSKSMFNDRLDQIQAAVDRWRGADDLEGAQAAAEAAANLVVGRNGPTFGDRDGDGQVAGDVAAGVLSGSGGEPVGLAESLRDVGCVRRDVLGATADDVDSGWDEMLTAIDEWTPTDNTMPSLASHPMRIVGWATFTSATTDLDVAHEYAGHAQLHVDVSRDALDC